MDAQVLSLALIAITSFLGWAVTQGQARNKGMRSELRWRRKMDLLKDRYIYRLEQALSVKDMDLPEKPEGWEEMEGEHW